MKQIASMFKLLNGIEKELVRKSPEILTGFAVAGFLTATICAVKATPKALQLIEEEEEVQDVEELSVAEIIKTTWKCYIPSFCLILLSIFFLIGAHSVNTRRNAALATAYSLSQEALKEYRDKVVETVGEKKEEAIRDSIAKDKLEKNPVQNSQVIITDKGNMLCYLACMNIYFESDIETLRHIENELNKEILVYCYTSLNSFFDKANLPRTDLGDDLGWNNFVEFDYSYGPAKDGRPCLIINFLVEPRYDFRNLH